LSVRLLALLEKMTDHADPDDVHKLRTTVRRLEVRLVHRPPKVAKSLRSLRKRAGKVRDIDVHLELLKASLFTAPAPIGKASSVRDQLRSALKSKRTRHEDSLLRLVADAAPLLESKLPKAVRQSAVPEPDASTASQRTAEARQRFLQWTRSIPEAGAQLHRLRIDAKKLRYSLEPLSAFVEAAEMVDRLKQVQDAIGSWHDWATLLELANRELDSPDSEPAYAALEGRVTREFNKAHRIGERVRQWMESAKPAASALHGNSSQNMLRKAG
jgi:CHAD domain-containing protein